MSKQEYQPLEDRVLIKPIKKGEEVTAGGIVVAETVKRETSEGVVIACGDGYTTRDTGVFIQTLLKKGDIVLYGINSGMPIEVPNESGGKDECRLMREGDVLIFIKKSD